MLILIFGIRLFVLTVNEGDEQTDIEIRIVDMWYAWQRNPLCVGLLMTKWFWVICESNFDFEVDGSQLLTKNEDCEIVLDIELKFWSWLTILGC